MTAKKNKTMKHHFKKILNTVLCAATVSQLLSLASCAREDFNWLIGTPVNVTASAQQPATRAGANIQTSAFEAGATLNAYFSITGSNPVNYIGGNPITVLTASAVNGDGKNPLTPDVQPYYPSEGTVDIYALYPNVGSGDDNKQVTASTTSFSVEDNQTTSQNYKKSDLMWTETITQGKTTNDVNLVFTHKMAKMSITVTGQEGVTIKSIKLVNTVREISISNIDKSTRALGALASPTLPADKQIVVATSSAANGDGSLSGSVLFPPQTITNDFIEIETYDGTTTGTIVFSVDKVFASGIEYKANLVVTRQMIGFTSTITDWTSDNGSIAVPPGSSAGLVISNIGEQHYTGSEIKPEMTLTYTLNSRTFTLEENVDYKLTYFNNINQGTATIIIEGLQDPNKIGQGDQGAEEAATSIGQIRAIKSFVITAATGNISYPNNDADVSVEYGYNATIRNKLDTIAGDGTVTFSSDRETVAKVSESGVVTIVGVGETVIRAHMADDGNYTTDDAHYKLVVTPRNLRTRFDATNNQGVVRISLPVNAFTYTGQAYRPAVTVTDNARTLLEGTHFTYTVTNDVAASTNDKKGTIVVRGTGNYSNADSAMVTLNFTISKANPNLQLVQTPVKLSKGHSYTRRATSAYGANNITWSVSPTGYATVSDGVVTAIEPTEALTGNKVTITATVPADPNGNWDAQSLSYDLTVVKSEWSFTYSGGQIQSWTCPLSGYYELEAMGARGGSVSGDKGSYEGGKGADIAGQVYITEGQVLYIYLGQAGAIQGTSKVFNGGGYYTGTTANNETTRFTSGGGATDFALKNATWDSNDHLYSRILVAGGGGGALYYYNSDTTPRMRSGDGGGGGGNADIVVDETKTDGSTITYRQKYAGQAGLGGSHPGGGGTLSSGGALTTPGTNGNAGTFGKGGNYGGTLSGGAGGGGWYGGASGAQVTNFGSGGGGSSFMFNTANVNEANNNYRQLLKNQINTITSGNYFNADNLEISETTLVMGGAPNTQSNPNGQARITYKSETAE